MLNWLNRRLAVVIVMAEIFPLFFEPTTRHLNTPASDLTGIINIKALYV